MLAGTMVVGWVSSPLATWIAMIILLTMHLGTNYLAVRAVCMTTLNRQRANIVFSHYLSYNPPGDPIQNEDQKLIQETSTQTKVLSPDQVRLAERIFEWDGVLRWNNSEILGTCVLGVDLQSILKEMSHQDPITNSFSKSPTINPKRIIRSLETRGYFLWYSSSKNCFFITLSTSSTTRTQLLAWFHALLAAMDIYSEDGRERQGASRRRLAGGEKGSALEFKSMKENSGDFWTFLDDAGDVAAEKFKGLWKGMEEQGWDLEISAMETKSGTRVKILGSSSEERKLC